MLLTNYLQPLATGTQLVNCDSSSVPIIRDQNDLNQHFAKTMLSLQNNLKSVSDRINSLELNVNVSASVRARQVSQTILFLPTLF